MLLTASRQIPKYTDLLSAVSAIDSPDRLLYVYMNDGSSPMTNPRGRWIHESNTNNGGGLPSMNLVGIYLGTGTVVSSHLACQQFPDCPWNLEYQE